MNRARCKVVVALCLLAGCGTGEGPATSRLIVGPHGGPTVPLPRDRGYAEVVLEPMKTAGRASSTRPRQHVVAYFYAPDMKTCLQPLPREVGVDLKIRGQSEPTRVKLAPNPDDRFPFKESRFASPAEEFHVEQLMGDLKGNFDGEEFAIAFAGRA